MSGSSFELTEMRGGTRLRLRVKPGARRNVLLGMHGGALKLCVSAPPERGRANDAVIAQVAQALGLPRDSVKLVSGSASQDKAVFVPLPPEEVRARLNAALATARG